jgi:beta-aspartyl-peptidase (threonine type)
VSASSAIEEALARQKRAWNDGKLEDFMAEYWKSDELTFYSGGTVTKGWQPTLDRYRKRYQGEGKEMGKLDFSDIRIDVISPDAAIVRARWNQVFSDKSQGGLFTLWMRKIDGKWKIVHDHTSAADPPKPPEPAGKKD